MNHFLKLLFLFFLPFTVKSQNLESDIDTLMKKYRSLGLAVVVVKNNKIVYNKAFGYKNLETKTRLATNDIFRIASISKSFSATAIMQLVAQKKLSLTDDVSNLIGFRVRNPNFPDQPITLQMLLTHRSSLNDSQGYFTLDSINPTVSDNWSQCYNSYAPGTKYQYCNYNFNIIGTIIERVSGERFDQYIKHYILDPLNVYGGYCVDSLDDNLFTTLYEYDSKTNNFSPSPDAYAPRREQLRSYRFGYSAPLFSPTGGMKISAEGLARYMLMHINYGKANGKRIIPKKYAKLMQTPVSIPVGYAMAIMNINNLVNGVHLTGHTGSAYGLYSAMFFNPKKKYGFVVITNSCKVDEVGAVNPLSKSMINLLYQHFIN